MMPVILLGLLYSGVTTPTEAAAAAAAYRCWSRHPLSQHRLARRLQLARDQRAHHDLDRHADRRGAGLQLRDHGREHPETVSAALKAYELSPLVLPAGGQHPAAGPGLLPRGHHDPARDRPVLIPRRRRSASTPVHFGVSSS
jgi:hypothetical protein